MTSFNKSIISLPENIKALEAETFKVVKKEIHFKFVDNKNSANVDDGKPMNDMGIDINIID